MSGNWRGDGRLKAPTLDVRKLKARPVENTPYPPQNVPMFLFRGRCGCAFETRHGREACHARVNQLKDRFRHPPPRGQHFRVGRRAPEFHHRRHPFQTVSWVFTNALDSVEHHIAPHTLQTHEITPAECPADAQERNCMQCIAWTESV